MRDYREMSPCERIDYYRQQIVDMLPPRSSREHLLIKVFRQLISENEPLCERAGGDGGVKNRS